MSIEHCPPCAFVHILTAESKRYLIPAERTTRARKGTLMLKSWWYTVREDFFEGCYANMQGLTVLGIYAGLLLALFIFGNMIA